ncbi:hypothetical protein [Streptomyces sp. NPDC048473]|uniref:hypothetical protein n=1 Tax=unclassified Streptomyces TaxID=2593676 RepID=UPI003718FE3E
MNRVAASVSWRLLGGPPVMCGADRAWRCGQDRTSGATRHAQADRPRAPLVDPRKLVLRSGEADSQTFDLADHPVRLVPIAGLHQPTPPRDHQRRQIPPGNMFVQPKHGRATLGTMLGEFKGNARPKFTTARSTQSWNDAIAPVEAMMRALWDGQTSRHGKQNPTVPETLEAARAGLRLAATLVQWFASGAVVRNP